MGKTEHPRKRVVNETKHKIMNANGNEHSSLMRTRSSKHSGFLSLLNGATMNAGKTQCCLDRARGNSLGVARWQLACLSGLLAVVMPAVAQTKLKLSTRKPGTERVQLINNGDFQFQGPLTNGA